MNLIFPYSGRGFTPLVPNMLSIDSGRKPFLLFFASLAKFSSSCALAFLTPSLHKRAVSLYSSQVTCPCFHCLCSSFLLFSLTSRSQLSHAHLFPSLPDFLHLGTESSCTLWKASLKICQKGHSKVSLQPPLLQAEQPQLSQPFLIGELFQPSDHLRGPPLDPLQQLHVFLVLRTPELDAVLQVESHQSGVEGQNHFPQPAGHTSLDAAQDTVGLLGCERTLPAHVQLFIHQYPPRSFSAGLLSIPSSPSQYEYRGLP
ncbi:hypothetical protein QYF61_014582 [Mycteria americana]|uniref:Uncharacterized protein n=1 Tax=Mycteria americana TaxID=33587 RepID=A0AAN7MYW5_MYCAM|nr:hypothetical protein QYF61_014582 [Mycteria americana]